MRAPSCACGAPEGDQTMRPIKIEHGIPMPPSREELREQDDAQVLQLIIENPRITQRAIAEKLGWVRTTGVAVGALNWSRVFQAMERLREKGRLKR
jgi:Winged helix-turn-helix DNA-binding